MHWGRKKKRRGEEWGPGSVRCLCLLSLYLSLLFLTSLYIISLYIIYSPLYLYIIYLNSSHLHFGMPFLHGYGWVGVSASPYITTCTHTAFLPAMEGGGEGEREEILPYRLSLFLPPSSLRTETGAGRQAWVGSPHAFTTPPHMATHAAWLPPAPPHHAPSPSAHTHTPCPCLPVPSSDACPLLCLTGLGSDGVPPSLPKQGRGRREEGEAGEWGLGTVTFGVGGGGHFPLAFLPALATLNNHLPSFSISFPPSPSKEKRKRKKAEEKAGMSSCFETSSKQKEKHGWRI